MVNFLEDAITEATVGTDLEGKVSINLVEDPDYWSNMDKGLVDITLTAWGGSEMDPYAMMECYCSDTLLKGVGFDPYTATATITVNGEEMTKTLNEWYVALCQGEYINADTDTKNQVLAGMEEALLEYYFVIPVYYATSVGLYEQRLVLGSEEYVNCMIGYGSVMDMTFTMDDAEWAAYCAENNNQLSY
jgi:ABC-type transport system substrate-binding protein